MNIFILLNSHQSVCYLSFLNIFAIVLFISLFKAQFLSLNVLDFAVTNDNMCIVNQSIRSFTHHICKCIIFKYANFLQIRISIKINTIEP